MRLLSIFIASILFVPVQAQNIFAPFILQGESAPESLPVTFSAANANIKAGDGTGDTVDVQITVPSGLSNTIALAGVGLRYTYGAGTPVVQNVTDNVTFTRAEMRDAEHYGGIFYQTGITAGAKTFRLTTDGSNYIALWVAIYYNAAQTNPIRDSAFTSGTGAGPTLNISSNAKDLVVDHLYIDNGAWTPTTTPGVGQTERLDYDENESPVGQLSSSTKTGAATVTMSWTIESSFGYTLIAVSVKRAIE